MERTVARERLATIDLNAPARNLSQDEWSLLMRLGTPKARERFEGVVKSLGLRDVEETTREKVYETRCKFSTPEMKGRQTLVTYGLHTCVAIVAYNPILEIGFMGHATCSSNAVFCLDTMKQGIGQLSHTKLILYGGDGKDSESVEMVSILEGYLSANLKGIRVIGRDLLRGRETRVNQIYGDIRNLEDTPETYCLASAIGLDVKTGKILVPSNYT